MVSEDESARRQSDPKSIELAAFTEAGHSDVGGRLWDRSREAAEQAWRDCRRGMRKKYGARSPHGGWSFFVLFAAVLFGAFAAALASGFRTDPTETSAATAVLAALAGVADLIVLLTAGWRAWNWAAVRLQIGVAVATGAAAAFQLSRPVTWVTPIVVGTAVVGVAGVLMIFLVRALRPGERSEMDTLISAAVAEMQPDVDATAARLQAEVLAELSSEEQRRILAVRTKWLSGEESETPAGGLIIAGFLTDWNPYLASERRRRVG
ncbi:hypothetical protein DY023_04175 [Microbacterium bovistercoris]|uniref:Uncharacterized protein n=1 Tax=Microbacterium bovistercoris TaxID=2293570 RepID=A0A371NW88_9MICO|nr:hypothetical protein [Microbacterium bovistercoris]REJ07200.1 hypothetical protein DY023_04175 [Microbacterium bovistercoris]